MALPRRDVRFKLDDEVHRDLVACCDLDGVDIAQFVERLVATEVKKRVHAAVSLAERTGRMGTAAHRRERQA